jgi:hypothetical protein
LAENQDIARRLMKKFMMDPQLPELHDRFPRRSISPSADDLSSWEDCEDGRLMGPMIVVAGTAIHLEAIEVIVFDDGSMAVKNEEDEAGASLIEALEEQIDSAHETVEFSGRRAQNGRHGDRTGQVPEPHLIRRLSIRRLSDHPLAVRTEETTHC